MALVKKSALGARAGSGQSGDAPVAAEQQAAPRRPRAQRASTPAERIDQATGELAAGLIQASAASTQLQRAMEQISSGAEEAAGAAQESLGTIAVLNATFRDASERAELSRRRADAVRSAYGEVGTQIDGSAAAVELNARRQLGLVDLIGLLESGAADLSEIGRTVAETAEETGLLALNAAVEAARVGEEGRGFAIVADEVRLLAGSSETSARDISALAQAAATEVKHIAADTRAAASVGEREAASARAVLVQLDASRQELAALAGGVGDIVLAAAEIETASRDAERGAEVVATAAEEQSAAAAEAQQAIAQQTQSLDQSQDTAESLGDLAAALREGGRDHAALEQVAVAAEQLSATVQQLSGAATEIVVAVDQIGRGAQSQAAATIQAHSAMSLIEASAERSQAIARHTAERLDGVVASAADGRRIVSGLADGVAAALGRTRDVLQRLAALRDASRRIERVTDALALLAVQTGMLAVSGSVEATRSGEVGRGFAAVSADIRKLAHDAAARAERARGGVRAIQDGITRLERDLDQIASAAEVEVGRSRVVADRLGNVLDELAQTRAAVQAIEAGADRALTSVREIRLGTEQIAGAAEQARVAAREAGRAAAEQAQGAEALAATIEEIASLAGTLQRADA
ncbi:methyl-accepting chemotaxis protein [uncultured Sphingomonas sp.]|uniref:methyl-accepting chemotaxis protein n=1 Tax=uncultured Sphingomonas sp. TaxID=158754 RepID=UPI0026000D5F|nr:methyl-accepting chemotaxis protein [uncultured Sphingomonas sp.]